MVTSEKKALFSGVYGRNRNFRIYLSTKQGKGKPLLLWNQDLLPINESYSFFRKTLVTDINYSNELKLLDYQDQKEEEKEKSIVFPSNSSTYSLEQTFVQGKSPYPLIDAYVIHLLSEKDGAPSFIRSWSYFLQGKVLVYQMGGSKYCDLIKRQHKSNHVVMIVDFRHGMIYQKCLDPECRKKAFKSYFSKIPSELDPFKSEQGNDEKMFEGIDDEDILHLDDPFIV
jgi:hypothetical protein